MPRKRKCPCGEWFEPKTTMHRAHCLEGALILDMEKKAKRARKEQREAKERVKDWRKLRDEADLWFGRYIRLRDEGDQCISCGKTDSEIPDIWASWKWDCGHFLSKGARPELRYEEDNAHSQCKACNGGSAFNKANEATVQRRYEERLRVKIGDDRVDWLKGPHEPARWRADDYRAFRDKYKAKYKELKDGRASAHAQTEQ